MTQELTLLEKYKPKELSDLRLPIRIMNILGEMQNRQGSRALFYSGPGTGKTSTANILYKDKDKYDVLYLSGSNNFNVEVMNSKIYPFCSAHSALGKQKCVVIDECELIRGDLQKSFKIILDKAVKVNFLFISNHRDKMNEALLSRLTEVSYDRSVAENMEQLQLYIQFISDVITKEGMESDAFGINQLYKKCFPDYRNVLVSLQQLKDSKLAVTAENVNTSLESLNQDLDLYTLLMEYTAPNIFYEKCSEYKGREYEVLSSLSEPFFLYLNSKGMHDKTLLVAVVVAKYSEMLQTSVNKFTTLLACISELKTLIR